MIYNNNGII